MPKNYEYVLAAYLIWTVTFLAYLIWLRRRDRTNRQALERLGSGEAAGKAGS